MTRHMRCCHPVSQAVNLARGNVAEAERALGLRQATVHRKLGAPRH